MFKKEALKIVGGLSNASKMPSKSIGLPAKECSTGSTLRKIENSVCSDCYALKGQYQFGVVQKAQYRRLKALVDPRWIEAMSTLLIDQDYFRWHDSGDIQNMGHLENMMKVIRATPKCKHWIPTKEKATIKRWLKAGNTVPENCVIRLSAPMINQRIKHHGDNVVRVQFSAVHTDTPLGQACIAPQQAGECRDCRACWNSEIECISYCKH